MKEISNTIASCSPLTEEGRWLDAGVLCTQSFDQSQPEQVQRKGSDLEEERKRGAIVQWAPRAPPPGLPTGLDSSCIYSYGSFLSDSEKIFQAPTVCRVLWETWR